MRKHILVVDDEEQIRRLVHLILARKGYAVDEAADGLEALTRLQQADYDLIVSDIQMPHLDGHQFLDLALNLKPLSRIVFMSGLYSDEMIAGLHKRGAVHFISKPFSLQELEAGVENSLIVPHAQVPAGFAGSQPLA